MYMTDRLGDNEIWVRDIDSATDQRIITIDDFSEADQITKLSSPVVISPDSRYVAFCAEDAQGEKATWISSLATGLPFRAFPENVSNCDQFFSWSPDSQFLIGGPQLHVVRVGNPESVRRLFLGRTMIYPIWSPVYEQIVAWPYPNDYLLLFTPEGDSLASIPRKLPIQFGTTQFVMTWSGDGSQLYMASSRKDGAPGLFVVDVPSGQYSKLGDYLLDFRFISPWISTSFGSLSSDGTSFLTTAQRSTSDIYIYEGFSYLNRRRRE